MTAHELVAKIARMTDPIDAEDSMITLARLVIEAQKIAALPQTDSAELIAEARDHVAAAEDSYECSMMLSLAIALEAAESRAVDAERRMKAMQKALLAMQKALIDVPMNDAQLSAWGLMEAALAAAPSQEKRS